MRNEQETSFLIVDDQRLIHEFVGQVLREMKYYKIHSAYDGDEAKVLLDKALGAKTPVDVVFLDYGMPNMNGLEVLKHFRSRPEFDATAFVMLTAESEEKNVREVLRAGANSYIVKPMSREGLKKKIQEIQSRLNSGNNKWFDRPRGASR